MEIRVKMENPKVRYSFEEGILIITYEEGALIEVKDVIEYYDHGFELSKGQKFCVIFHAVGRFTVTREAWEYIAENPYPDRIHAKAYVTDSPETDSKANFHIRMDKPQLVPLTFWNLKAAKKKMREILLKEGSKF
jgi:hypothetical protein